MLEDIGINRAEAKVTEPKALLEGVMNRHTVRQPATAARSPYTNVPSSRRLAAAPEMSSTAPEAWALPGTAAAGILGELDEVVRKSHRPSALRRMLHRMGGAFARPWSRMVPEPPPPQSDLPPEIWFPWFFL